MTEINYTGVFRTDARRAFHLLTDEAFLSAYAQEMGAVRHGATVERRATETVARLDWTVPTEGIPGFLKGIVGHEIGMVQLVTWSTPAHAVRPDGQPTGTLSLDVKAARKGHLRGSVRLFPDSGGTRFDLKGNIAVKVPLVGGKVEGMARELVREALDDQTKLGNRWLEEGYEGPLPA